MKPGVAVATSRRTIESTLKHWWIWTERFGHSHGGREKRFTACFYAWVGRYLKTEDLELAPYWAVGTRDGFQVLVDDGTEVGFLCASRGRAADALKAFVRGG